MARLPVHRVRAQASPGALGPYQRGQRVGGGAAVFAGMGPRPQPGEELPLQDTDRTARSSPLPTTCSLPVPRCIRPPGSPRPTAVPLPPPQAAVPGPSTPSQARRGEILWLLLLCLRGPAWLTASLPWVLPGRGLVWCPLTPEGISGGSTVYFQLIFCFPIIFETEFLKF